MTCRWLEDELKKTRCGLHLLVGVRRDEVAGCRVDGDGGGTGAVHWNCAVELQTKRNCLLLLSW